MSFERAKSRLGTTRFKDLRHVDDTGSTNRDVHDLLGAIDPGHPGLALVADHQRAGRGRLGRTWEAPSGASILCSIGWPTRLPPELRPLTAALVGLAARLAVGRVCGIDLGLKWPNDLVAPGAGRDGADLKVGGILAESAVLPGPGAVVVVGIGLNCTWPEMPPELADTATSLNLLGATSVDRFEILTVLLGSLSDRVTALEGAAGTDRLEAELAALQDEYLHASVTVGRDVRVEATGSTLVGTATGVTRLGELLVEDESGAPHVVAVGDVVHLRPR